MGWLNPAGERITGNERFGWTQSATDGADLIPPPSGKPDQFLSINLSNGLVATRTAGQVLYLVFGMKAGVNQGGFFPNGLNGAITTSSEPATDANLG